MKRICPKDPEMRKKVILAIFGSPDKRQIDGLGGGRSLDQQSGHHRTIQEAGCGCRLYDVPGDISQPSIRFSAEIAATFPPGVGPFAIDEGLVRATGTGNGCSDLEYEYQQDPEGATFLPMKGKSKYTGDYAIDGVPGTGSKILLDYSATEGAATGKLLPTGNATDIVFIPSVGEIEISIVDAGNPMCFIKPEVLGFSGIEGPLDQAVVHSLEEIERIRGTAAKILGFVDDPAKARIESPAGPLLAIVSEPRDYDSFTDDKKIKAEEIDFVSRSFFMQEMHKTYAGTGTVCTGVAALIDGTLVNRVCSPRAWKEKIVRIGHPSGTISIEVDVVNTPNGPELKLAAFARTSRRIMEGFVYVPEKLFEKG